MSFAGYTNPAKFGPGTWYCIHVQALYAISPELQSAYCEFIKIIADRMGCDNCGSHFKEYIEQHPPDKYIGASLDQNGYCAGLFGWTVRFHNTVNVRLGHEVVSYEKAYTFFTRKKEKKVKKRAIVRHVGGNLKLTMRGK